MDYTVWLYLDKRYINDGGEMIPLDTIDDKDYYCVCDDEGTIWKVRSVQKGRNVTPEMILTTMPDDGKNYHICKINHLEFANAFIKSYEAVWDAPPDNPSEIPPRAIFPKDQKFIEGTANVKARLKNGAIERKRADGAWEIISSIQSPA